MRNIKHAKITLSDGSTAVLSTTELPDGSFETMLASPDFGHEYAVIRSTSEAQALSDFKHLRSVYHVPPLTGKYLKLSEDLKKALEIGRLAEASDPEDGGTCNFDSAAICLPRWNHAKVEQAAKAAGTRCFTWKIGAGMSYVFGPDTKGQGNARSRNAEAMTNALRAMGYLAFDYSQMD